MRQQETSESRRGDRLGYFLCMERDEFVRMVVSNLSAAIDRKQTNPAEVARRAGLNPTAVYDILTGKSRSPKLDTVNKIAAALGVPFSALLTDPKDELLDQELIEALLSMSPDDRRRFLAMARALMSSSASAE